jgi:gamma-glutamyltranspeptidase/glutathione hydrolase
MSRIIAFGNRDGMLARRPEVRAYLFDEAGAPWPAGHVIVNQAYADTLRAIQRDGSRGLLTGPIAQDIVAVAHEGERPSSITLDDLAAYAPRELEPVCGAFRSHRVCSMGGTASGAIPMLQILGLYEAARPTPVGADDIDDWSAFLWATRLAFADRNHYLGDHAFVPVPKGLTDPRYLASRARRMGLEAAPTGELPPGDPSPVVGGESLRDHWGWDHTLEVPGTSHLSIVDHEGNAVVMTQTVESEFGAMRMTHGFFLNNELTDFSLEPTRLGGPVANAVAPHKRPRSSMTPTLIFDVDGNLEVAIGSPGGSAIIGYVALTIIGYVDWRMPFDEAVELPHLTATSSIVRGELDRLGEARASALRSRGWTLEQTTMEASGLYGVAVEEGHLVGADDSRRPGVARLAPSVHRSPER